MKQKGKTTKTDSDVVLSPEAVEARRRYKAEWRKANADRLKAYYADYWQRKAEQFQREQEQDTPSAQRNEGE